MSNTFSSIESNCAELAELRAKMRRKLELKQKAQNALDTEHNPGLRELQEKCNATRAVILIQLGGARKDFLSPKTREFHGVTVGFKKKQDSLLCPEDSILIKRIEEMVPSKVAETVLDRTTTIIKNAFKKLPWDTLQKLGCSKVSGADNAIVLTSDDDVEELAKKTLGDPAPATT